MDDRFNFCRSTKLTIVSLFQLLNIVIWLVAAGLAILVLYGLWDPDNMYPDLSKEVSALYNATFRNVWAATVVWVVIACATDNGGRGSKGLN